MFLVFWQQGGRCVECLVLCEAREARGGQRTSQPHLTPLCLRPRDLGARPRPEQRAVTRPEARGWCGGEAAPIRGQGSKGSPLSPLSSSSSNRRREITIGNTILYACLSHGQEIKKAIETQSLKSPLYKYCISVFQWGHNTGNLLQFSTLAHPIHNLPWLIYGGI